MAKSRRRGHSRSRKSFLRKMKRSTRKALPAVKRGLTKIGRNVSTAAKVSAPAIKKGFGTIFNAISRGLDAGISKVKSLTKSKKRSRR
jgi:hypothetical protein